MDLTAPQGQDATRGGASEQRPDQADECLRLLARALIDTAVQVHDQVLTAGIAGGVGHTEAEALEGAAGSRYPATPRACSPAQRRRPAPAINAN